MKLRVALAGAAAVAAGVALLVAAGDARLALGSYLVAFAWALSLALGALAWLMIAYATGAGWFVVFRRAAEALALAVVPLAGLFVPVLLGARTLYPWAWPARALDPVVAVAVARRHAAFSQPFFTARAVVFLAAWSAVALLLRFWSVRADGGAHPGDGARARALAGAALPGLALTMTCACFDWFMSMEPAWSSNLYGVYVFVGGFTAAVAAVVLLAAAARRAGRLPREVAADHFHASGRVLLMAVALWGYIVFAQLLVVWIADIPAESVWYVVRLRGGWRPVAVALALGHFALPFLALLQRAVTRHPPRLALVAAWLVALHYLDVYWLLAPAAHPARAAPRLTDLGAMLVVVGVLAPFVAGRFAAVAAVPARDPALAAALEYRSR